jgi:lytic murein transglycosylase
MAWATAAALLTGVSTAGSALAACQNSGSFEQWLAAFRQEAAAQGLSRGTIAATLDGVAYDPSIVRRDRGQGVFQQSFLQFSDRMAAAYRIQGAQQRIQKYGALFAQIEQKFGVPAPVLTSFWGLESDFGSNNGNFRVISALATLAYDCRRPAFFRPQLMDALRIVERGDLRASEMIGDWAGELGPMQITASDYYKHAVDFDGDGRRDAVRSVPDTLASGANLLLSFGWRRGEPWLQEVRVPANLPWDQADLNVQQPRAQWVRWGVTAAHGQPLPADNMPASLLLPMGRFGPAFLAYNNFKAFLGWNSAMVYSTTAAYLATRIAGAPPVGRGAAAVPVLSAQQIAELQRLLVVHRLAQIDADGKLGNATRAGVKAAQMKLGLPADSYPTAELIERLRATR